MDGRSMDDGAPNSYRRLPGKGPHRSGLFSGLVSRCSLYLAKDHILSVENQGFSEDYKRFYFSDIQAIITRKTRRWPAWNIALVTAAGLAGLFFQYTGPVAGHLLLILGGLCLLFLVINILRGPTCVCHIMTAVQEEQLPSLNRVRVARKVIAILKEKIAAVQGTLNPEEIETSKSEAAAAPVPLVRESQRARSNGRKMRHYDGTIHMIAFGLMLADGILTSIILLHHMAAMTAASSVLGFAYCVCIIIALTKQYGSDIPRIVRGTTWASLGFICVSFFLSYILLIATFISKPRKQLGMMSQWQAQSEMYRAVFALSPKDSPLVTAVYIFAAVCLLGLGALGLITVKGYRDDSARAYHPDAA